MATLISPGVSVTVQDESFYIPSSSPTVPLILIATADNKLQPNGTSSAVGTLEHGVVRTVTSLSQSLQLYGLPRFLESQNGEQHHGDSRNEYGLFALNRFLGIGNRAYVVRANVNLNDDRDDIVSMWTNSVNSAAEDLEVLANALITNYNTSNGYTNIDVEFKQTITELELLGLIEEVMSDVYKLYNFNSTTFKSDLMDNHNINFGGDAALVVYNTDFTVIQAEPFMGIAGVIKQWIDDELGSVAGFESEWTPSEAAGILLGDEYPSALDYAYTMEFLGSTALGANDASRRSAIVTALQATANLDLLRAEAYEYNLIVCPGYFEVTDELNTLAVDIGEEAVVIGDVPMNKDPEECVTWAVSSSMNRVFSNLVVYYYGHGYGSNLDGKNVLGSSSGEALRVYARSDNMSQVWFAPAGAQRGVISGASMVGYFTGTPGTPTTFVEAVLNQGIRDNLYKDGTNINPITFMPGRGIIVMGQKTSAPVSSALDRINAVRLVAYIRRALRKNSFPFIFEPNDQLTRDNLKAMVDGFLGDIVVKRGLYDFATLCDSSNNGPDRIDRSEMYLDVAIKIVKATEFLYIPIRVVSTGAEI